MSLPTEQWRPAPGFEGRYEVSTLGRIRSLPNRLNGGMIRKLDVKPNGYWYVGLSCNGRTKNVYVHQLVTEAFVGPRPDGMVVRHLDGDKNNNSAVNLMWGTPSENSQDVIRHGRNKLAARTHCKQGHEFTEANTMPRGKGELGRRCRECRRALERRRYWAAKTQ